MNTYSVDPATVLAILEAQWGSEPLMEARLRAAKMEAALSALAAARGVEPSDPEEPDTEQEAGA
jgi:hypothetical protein